MCVWSFQFHHCVLKQFKHPTREDRYIQTMEYFATVNMWMPFMEMEIRQDMWFHKESKAQSSLSKLTFV